MKYQSSMEKELEETSPLSLRVLEKLCRQFPEASQEEIFTKFWAMAREDKTIMHSATWQGFNNHFDNILAKVMARISGKNVKYRRSKGLRVWRAD
jgi:hypothetical protein